MAVKKSDISEAIKLPSEPVLLEDLMKKKLNLRPFGNFKVPKIILEHINTNENFSILSGKSTRLEKYDVENQGAYEAQEHSDDDIFKGIPNFKQERINNSECSAEVAINTVINGMAKETKVSKTVFTDDVENNTWEKVINPEITFHPDMSVSFSGANILSPNNICVKIEEMEDHQKISNKPEVKTIDRKSDVLSYLKVIKNENDENNFVFSTDGEIVSLKTEEVIFDDDSSTEAELCANDTLLASCLATSGRKSGLRRLEKRSYRTQYACDQCVEKFRFLKDLKCHLKEHSSSLNKMVINSTGQPQHIDRRKKLHHLDCPQQFQSLKNSIEIFEVHKLSAAPLQSVKQECPGLPTDARINLDIKSYCCIECPRKFSKVEDLYEHSKQHKHNFTSGKKKPELKNSIEKNSLRINPERRSYCCSDCPLKFRYFKDLHEHLGAHEVSATELSCANLELKQSIMLKEVRINLGKKVEIKKCDGPKENVCFTELDSEETSDARPGNMSVVQKSLWHSCLECPVKFQNLHGLHRHSVIHNKKNRLTKEKTDTKNTRKGKSDSKMNRLPERVFSCAHCPSKSKYKNVIKRHILLHINNEVYTCKLCSRQFRELRSYQRHASVHIEDKPFSCTLCSAKMKYWRSFKDHMRKHSLEHLAKKPLINQNETNNVSLILRDPIRILTAPCRNRAQDPEEKPFPCNLCSSRFTQNADLQRHFRHIHSKPRKYRCKLCPRMFSQDSTLKRHLQAHADEGRFVCIVCPANFNEKRKLKHHLKSHFSGDCFTCAKCSKRFRVKNKLQAHLAGESCKLKIGRLYAWEKRFKCPKCNAKFNVKSSLKKHLNSHHPENKFSCSNCSSNFQLKVLLKQHLQSKDCVQIGANPKPLTETQTLYQVPLVTSAADLQPKAESETTFKSPEDTRSTSEWTPDFIEVAGEPKFMLINSKVPYINKSGVHEVEQWSSSKYSVAGETETAVNVSSSTNDFKEIINAFRPKSDTTKNEFSSIETLSDTKCAEWIILNYADKDGVMIDVEN